MTAREERSAASAPGRAAISQESALVKLDDLRTALLDFAEVYLPVGDARMLVLSAAEKVGMAADAIEAEYV